MRTHYQNLKVAEDAPTEVIKAAWRALSQQYHPDKNPGDSKAVHVMQILNEAYDVLSDPVKRSKHDEAIRKFRASPTPPHKTSDPTPTPKASAPAPAVKEKEWLIWKEKAGVGGPFTLAMLAAQQRAGTITMQTYVCEHGTDEFMTLRDLLIKLGKLPGAKKSDGNSWGRKALGLMAAYPRISIISFVYCCILVASFINDKVNTRAAPHSYASTPTTTTPYVPSYTAPYVSTPAPVTPYYTSPPLVTPAYVPPATVIPSYPPPKVPYNGSAAPRQRSKAQYVRPLTAPNGQVWPMTSGYVLGYPVLANGSYCEVTIDNTRRNSDVHVKVVALPNQTVRNCFIRAGQSFTMGKLDPGDYEIRYRDLDTGGLAKSEAFDLQVISNSGVINYSTLSLTLYTVKGAIRTWRISPRTSSNEDET